MNINRHNYETFFLLYVDNELSAAERKAVEQFVQENIDLEPELQLLIDATLPAETISFNAKNLLYKSEVDQDALQENLLLHLDNELDPIAALKMNEAIASNSSMQQEWEILQQTKLDVNEKIIFEGKHLLYRHEKDRVISIRFWRVAAAAAILFACLFTGIKLLKKEGTVEKDVVKKTATPSIEKKAGNGNNPPGNSINPVQEVVNENTASVNEQEQKNTSSTSDIKTSTTQDRNETASNDGLDKKKKNVSPKIPLENINKERSNKEIVSAVLNRNNETVPKNKIPNEIASVSMKEKIKAPDVPIIDYDSELVSTDSYAKTAVLDETESENNNKIFYMNEESVKRSKIGGLFRRVKRVIERKTNIKTGDGITIAGFEIAVK